MNRLEHLQSCRRHESHSIWCTRTLENLYLSLNDCTVLKDLDIDSLIIVFITFVNNLCKHKERITETHSLPCNSIISNRSTSVSGEA